MPQNPAQTQPPQAPPQGAPGAPGGPAGQRAPGQGARMQRTPLPTVPPEFDALPIWKSEPAKLVAMVKDANSTVFQKAIAMKKLAFVGGKDSIQPMAAHLTHPQLSCYARFGLEPNPDPSVDEALRSALPKVQGRLKVGVITSIGVRKDAKALDALTKLMNDSDPEIAGAAAASIGMIGGMAASRALQAQLAKVDAPSFPIVARACLMCVESVLPTNKARAVEIFTALSAESMPGPVRRNAIRNLNAIGPAPAGAKDYPPPTGEAAEKDRSGFLGRG
jgi:hypothetical protein